MSEVRPMAPGERAFVVSAWSASYKSSHQAGLILDDEWAGVMHRMIDRILDHPSSRVLVCVEPGDLDEQGRPFCYGFIAFLASGRAWVADERDPYVLYVYVKERYRRARTKHGRERGFASELASVAGIDPERTVRHACSTPALKSIIRAGKLPLAEHDPTPARRIA